MFERMFAPIYEISSENKIVGRRPVKVVLHEIFQNETEFQENGVSWREEFVLANLHSVAGMSIVVEFLNEDRDIPYGHGMTDIRDEDNLPMFEDATMVGHFDRAYVDDVEINGEMKRVLIAEGTLDEMRYPKFVAWLREHMAESAVKGSVEIVGRPEHEGHIIYSGGWKEQGRVPQYYDYSGYAILGIKPADEAAIVMELNNKKTDKEDQKMEEKLKDLMAAVTGISTGISEQNAKWNEYWAKIDELQTRLTELNADYDKEVAAREAAETALAEANTAKETAEAKLTEANAKIAALEKDAAMVELNAALAPYTEEERAAAKEEIDAFTANPGSIEINSITGKICTAIVRAARDSAASEANSANQIDVFGMTEDAGKQETDDGDMDIF